MTAWGRRFRSDGLLLLAALLWGSAFRAPACGRAALGALSLQRSPFLARRHDPAALAESRAASLAETLPHAGTRFLPLGVDRGNAAGGGVGLPASRHAIHHRRQCGLPDRAVCRAGADRAARRLAAKDRLAHLGRGPHRHGGSVFAGRRRALPHARAATPWRSSARCSGRCTWWSSAGLRSKWRCSCFRWASILSPER